MTFGVAGLAGVVTGTPTLIRGVYSAASIALVIDLPWRALVLWKLSFGR